MASLKVSLLLRKKRIMDTCQFKMLQLDVVVGGVPVVGVDVNVGTPEG
jgi:hypothetical protein